MIGGEHEINLLAQRDGFEPLPDVYYYSSGRAALYHILRSIECQEKTIWYPDWLCHTMLDASQRAGFRSVYYKLNKDFYPTVNALNEIGFPDGGVLVVVNYFGLLNLTDSCKSVKEAYPHAVIIEDDVQAFFCFSEKQNEYADYRYTSLRKTFCIPDGGLVYTKKKMPSVTQPNTFAYFKIVAGVMKANRTYDGIRDEDYLQIFKEGNNLINENFDSRMSLISERLFAGTDFEEEKRSRRNNADYLLKGLQTKGIKPMIDVPTDSIPLFVPIYLENRDEVRKRMFQEEIFCPIHWPTEGMPVDTGNNMAVHELSLIVDQRYTIADIDRILNCL